MEEMFLRVGLDAHIHCLKDLQREHELFLDLKEDKVREKYLKTFPKGAYYLIFLYMICDMTKEDNLNNGVVINQIRIIKEKNRRR